MGKIFETIMAYRLSYMIETHQFLPTTHFGGQKILSTEHVAHHLLERIQKTWNTKKVAFLLLLDVAGAFNNVVNERLLYNLRKRRVEKQIQKRVNANYQRNSTRIATFRDNLSLFQRQPS